MDENPVRSCSNNIHITYKDNTAAHRATCDNTYLFFTMAHLFKQMYVNDIDFEAMTIVKMIDLGFTEMVYRKIQQLEEATDGNQWIKFGKRFDVLDEEERWIGYAEHALELLNHDVMWQGIIEACKTLKYPELSEIHRDYFEALFDMSCFVWFQMFSETKRTLSINSLIDYIIMCVN